MWSFYILTPTLEQTPAKLIITYICLIEDDSLPLNSKWQRKQVCIKDNPSLMTSHQSFCVKLHHIVQYQATEVCMLSASPHHRFTTSAAVWYFHFLLLSYFLCQKKKLQTISNTISDTFRPLDKVWYLRTCRFVTCHTVWGGLIQSWSQPVMNVCWILAQWWK